MTNIKKINLFICSLLMMLTSLFFVACGSPNYDSVSLTVSQSSVELQVGQSIELNFTINNMLDDMSNELKFEFSPSGKAYAETTSSNENNITVRVTATEAGNTTLTAKTKDGLKSCDINLFITKYSSSLQPNENNLYISSSNNVLSIKSGDFLFDDEANEKTLKYYFYGYNASNAKLQLSDVSSINQDGGRTFYNNFELIKLVVGQNNKNYLVFTDENGKEYTLSKEKQDFNYNNNIKYDLIEVQINQDGQYNFSSASWVNAGQKFTFIAYYENPNSTDEIYTQRDFVVLADLNKSEISKNYGYAVFINENDDATLSDQVYSDDDFSEELITLVPEYTKILDARSYVDFKNAIITISTPYDNDDLNYMVESSNFSACSFTYQSVKVESGTKYIINLSTKSTTVQDFNLTFRLYYQGFENSKDENVCVKIDIPVSIKSKPNQILISSDSFSNVLLDSKTFTFYNHYFSETTGWQRFYFNILPVGCNYKSLQITLPIDCGLQIRYNKKLYTEGQTLEIDNLTNFVEIKGVEGANVSNNLSLQVDALYNILTESEQDSEQISSQFNYVIKPGSTIIDFVDNSKKEINLSLNESVGLIDFSNQIYTDAYFDDFNISTESGNTNNVEIVKSEVTCVENDGKYYLQFGLIPKSVGKSTYILTLPNGNAISLVVNVIETLQYPSLSTTNKNANIEIVNFDQNNATIYARYNSENVYANNSFDLSIFANGDENTNSINSYSLSLNANSNLSILSKKGNDIEFLMSDTGVATITFTLTGYKIENFVVSPIELTYGVKVVVYELIKELNVNKLKDGQIEEYPENTSARYVYVYGANAYSTSKKQAQFQVNISQFNNDVSPFLFVDPATGLYTESKFDQKFIYWTLPSGYNVTYFDGTIVPDGRMYVQENQNSLYKIWIKETLIASFDVSSLTITLTEDASISFVLFANIEQFNIGVRSFSINVVILDYDAVESLSSLTPTSDLYFSTMETEQEFNLRVLKNSAINKSIKLTLEYGSFVSGSTTYNIFGDLNSENSGIIVNANGSVVNILFKVNQDFLENSSKLQDNFNAVLTIGAQDWYNDKGILQDEYAGKVLKINIKFGNGTEANPFVVDSVEDFEKINDNLSAYYQIVSTIDVSTLVERNVLPFGEFSGTIVGTKDYSLIKGLNFSVNQETSEYDNAVVNNAIGIFTNLAEGSVIKNVSFEGSFNINVSSLNSDIYIGLIAGQSKGTIENVSVEINKSNIEVIGLKEEGKDIAKYNAYIGGLVGYNSGIITQDFEQNTDKFKLYNYMVFMNDFINIFYKYINVYAGGITGKSEGLIQKIDSDKIVYGYSNYLAYSLIKTSLIPETLQTTETDAISIDYVGSVAGQIVANAENRGLVSKYSASYYDIDNYKQGKGIVVGGEVEGMSYVGGVVGDVKVEIDDAILGITTRTFVRGLSSKTNAGLIFGNVDFGEQSNIQIKPIFYVQAIDDGKTGENSSMIVLYVNEQGDQGENIPNFLDNFNKIAFGLQKTEIELWESDPPFINYVSRTQKGLNDTILPLDPTVYYGNAVIINIDENNSKTIREQCYFTTQGENEEFKIEGNIKNSNGEIINSLINDNNMAFFAYYFNAKELVGYENSSGILDIQAILDERYNTIEVGNSLYPFSTSSDLSLTSLNSDVLSINQSGKITITGTGWARISGSSILNVNKGVSFYVYVTNYFNPDGNISIVYTSDNLLVDQTRLPMFAKDTKVLYIRPNYLYSNDDATSASELKVDQDGLAMIGNYQFNLAQNTDITATVEIKDNSGKGADSEFSKSVIGQTIIITKEQTASNNQNFNVNIKTKLESSYLGEVYYTYVNKQLDKVTINYSKGAEAIGLGTYDNLTISTNDVAIQNVVLRSSASKDDEGILYYIYLGDKLIQDNSSSGLFNVEISGPNLSQEGTLIKNYQYSLTISVDKESNAYQNRFNEEIYGKYRIELKAKSNTAVYTSMYLTLENLPLQSIVIDNYNDFANMKENIGMSSEFTYPGNASLLAVTLEPEDSDFDYMLIEVADKNYQSGNIFELVARNLDNNSSQSDDNSSETQTQNHLFTSGVISGSATSRGLMITKKEIEEVYQGENFKDYNGVVYFKYELGNSGIVDNSSLSFSVKVYKDGYVIRSSSIDLTLKLKESVSLSIDGKNKIEGEKIDTYLLASGLRYKLNVQSYGFNDENIELFLKDNSNLVTLEKVNGEYYIEIASQNVNSKTQASVQVIATRMDGDNEITASNSITLLIMNYVVDDELNNSKDLDVITNMVNGVITMPIGSSKTVKVDIYDFIEYDTSNQLIVNMVNNFVNSLNNSGKWSYYSNIKHGEVVPAVNAGQADTKYDLYPNIEEENYYFKYNNFAFVPLRINNPDANLYYMYYEANYKINPDYTGYEVTQNTNQMKFSTTVRFDVYVSSSEESPIPIFNYEDFLNMKTDGHYILLNDIILPSKEYVGAFDDVEQQYMPLNGNFASLDGNGHFIVLDGTYDFGSASELGIFTQLSANSVIKNLNIKLLSSFDTGYSDYGVIFKTSNPNNSIGILVANNNGMITNCKISSPTNKFFTVESPLGGVDASYFGSICGQNFGFITNCGSSIYAYGSFNLAGIAGINSGKIAASNFNGGILKSSGKQLGEAYHIGGLVYRNIENGQIITSFSTSGISNNSLYSQNESSYLSSANYSAGFVYFNAGSVEDCYSDMSFGQGESGANMAGFVYSNIGSIENCFSLSILQSGNNASAGFAMYNYNFEDEQSASTKGVFENCYYLSHNHVNSGENKCEDCGFNESINISLNPVVFEGVTAIDDFNNLDYFDSYAYSNIVNTNAVWFYSASGDIDNSYVEFVPTNDTTLINNDNGIGKQYNIVYNVQNKTLPKGRLELVAPNIDVLSVRNFVSSETDSVTGDIIYTYQDDISNEATSFATRGTIYNPYLIYDAQTMESLILENNVPVTNQNSANYRLIADVNYSSYPYNSQIYNTVYIGNFEGNGMEISSIVLQSSSSIDYAGMFAQLGVSSSKSGVIKNLTVAPSSVIFSNATSVGALVGYINNGQLYNINVITEEDLIVTGSNFVGGVAGYAKGQYSFKNIFSNVSVVANYSPSTDLVYKEGLNEKTASYAGGLFGYLGSGIAYNLEVENIKTVRGDRTGLAIGGLGLGSSVSNVEVSSLSTTRIKAYRYGGIVVGEVVGKLSEVVVYDNGQESQTIFSIDQIPLAVGGVAGLVAGGTIENAVMQQSFKVEAKKVGISSIYSTVESVGGIAGLIANAGSSISNISKCVVDGEIVSSSRLGGAVGSIATVASLDQIAVKQNMKVEGQRELAILGGIIGNIEISPSPQVYLTNSYCRGNLTINTSNALNKPKAEIGGLVAVNSSNLIMDSCYTTSTLSVSLKDLNSIISMASFKGMEFPSEQSEGDAVEFYKQYNNNKITNCYYYGATGSASVNIVDYFIDVYSNFDIATKGYSEYLTINNYGQSSYGFSADYLKDDMKDIIVFGESCFEDISLPLDSEKIKTVGGKDVGNFDIAVGRVQRETSEILFIKEITKTEDLENYVEILEEDLNSLTEQETTISLYLYKNTPLWNGYNIANINTEFRTLTFENNLYWVKK